MENITYEQVVEWTKKYFASFDNGDEKYYDNFDENVVFQSANGEISTGLAALKTAFESVRRSDVFSAKHNLLQIIVNEEDIVDYVIAVEISIDYKLQNGKEFSLPCATFIKLKNFKVREHKAFMDVAPLFKALSE